ncbi:MAG: DUF1302 family protein [Candidatus Nitrospinota bacterium M3_3B_026]
MTTDDGRGILRGFPKALPAAFAALILIAAPGAMAQNEKSLDAVLEGFEEDKPEPSEKTPPGLEDVLGGFDEGALAPETAGEAEEAAARSAFDLGGAMTFSSSYNYSHGAPSEGETDWRGLSRLRSEIQLDLDVDIAPEWRAFISGRVFHDAVYSLRGVDNYTGDVLRTYEKEGELRDVYIQGSLMKSLDIKIGRQIVVWGRSDNIRVTDVLNPMDSREPGMVDIEDLRLPVNMTKLDYYAGPWNLALIAVHEIRFDKLPAYGSDFYSFPFPWPPEETPVESLGNTQYAAELTGVFPGWDVSFYWARYFEDQPTIERDESAPPGPGPMGLPPLIRTHSLLTMYGAAGNFVTGPWLLKAEAAFVDGLEFYNAPGEKRSRLDMLLGVEYAGFSETMLGLDIVNRRLLDYDPKLYKIPDMVKEDTFQAAFRYQGDFWRDTLHVVALVSILGREAEDGAFERFSVEYDIQDALSATLGVMAYHSGESLFFRNIDGADRVFASVKYSF